MLQGGPIMWVIFLVAIICLYLVIQRWLTWTLEGPYHPPAARSRVEALQAHAVQLHSQNRLEKGLPLLKGLVMITPLLGLVGTVSGMMLVFDGLSLGSSADPRLLATGIARAILPTFASMALVVLGLFFVHLWQRKMRRLLQQN